MITPSDVQVNPDVLPAQGIVAPGRLGQIQQHFIPGAIIVVTTSLHESIPPPLRASDMPSNLPALRQPMVIGVQVGPQAGNLAVVGFRAKEHLASFLEAYPPLKTSLVTFWNGHLLLWLNNGFLRQEQDPG